MTSEDSLLDDVRFEVYQSLATTGATPSRARLEAVAGDPTQVERALRALHDAHALVVGGDGSIRMALPFSAIPTDHVVRSSDGRRWWANCAWDALAIPSLVGCAAQIDAPWLDDGSPAVFEVDGAGVRPSDGLVHFQLPTARWWDDIVET